MKQRHTACFCFALLAAPGLAIAHSPIKSLNGFYNGLLHPVFVPAQLLLLIVVGLFFGQQGMKENLTAVGVFMAATATGLVAAWFSSGSDQQTILLSIAAIVGVLIAASPTAGRYLCTFIGAVAGFFLGLDSAQETLSGKLKFLSLFGSGVGIYLLMLYPMGIANFLQKKHWQKTAIRIVGSWLAASSLLVLALSFSSVTK
jgi:urease accessory protein